MHVTIQNINGGSVGPFDIYYDIVDPAFLVATNVSSASLAAGVDLTVTDTATSLIVVNTRTGCGFRDQTLALPPAPGPTIYHSVDVSARMGNPPSAPQTSSVYYRIDAGPYNYLGDFSSSVCVNYTSIPVPENSTISLGILSGSNPINSINFAATNSAALCGGTTTVTDYCGITTPYSYRVTGSTVISMRSKMTQAGTQAVCSNLPPPPPPPPVDQGSTEIKINLAADNRVNFSVTASRSGIDTVFYSEQDSTIAPQQIFTTPYVDPGDIITINLSSADPIGYPVAIRIVDYSDPANPFQFYRTPGSPLATSYQFTIPLNTDTAYEITATGT